MTPADNLVPEIAQRPRPRLYRRLAPVLARRATAVGVIAALEGPLRYTVGDYVCLGILHEEWPVAAARFEASHRQVSTPDDAGYAQYEQIHPIRARQMRRPFTIINEQGEPLAGKAGDYRATTFNGLRYVIDAQVFGLTYARVHEARR